MDVNALATCPLCQKQRALRVSHFMPAALYPKNKKQVLSTRTQAIRNPPQVTASLLCGECEQRFNRGGENDVLRWIAPKAKKEESPLAVALRDVRPDWTGDDLVRYPGAALGIAPEKLAYFALSLVWRASVCEWSLPDGGRTTPLDLKEFAEPVRRFLLGEAPFPDHIYLTVTLCTDDRSREYWVSPSRTDEAEEMVLMTVLDVMFKFWLGSNPPGSVRRMLFWPAPAAPIFATHCWDFLSIGLGSLAPLEPA